MTISIIACDVNEKILAIVLFFIIMFVMTLLEQLEQKRIQAGIGLLELCRAAGMPDSTYIRARHRGSCTMVVYERLNRALQTLSSQQ